MTITARPPAGVKVALYLNDGDVPSIGWSVRLDADAPYDYGKIISRPWMAGIRPKPSETLHKVLAKIRATAVAERRWGAGPVTALYFGLGKGRVEMKTDPQLLSQPALALLRSQSLQGASASWA